LASLDLGLPSPLPEIAISISRSPAEAFLGFFQLARGAISELHLHVAATQSVNGFRVPKNEQN
jgi:hypothetical protein